jgi:hypothetical protein
MAVLYRSDRLQEGLALLDEGIAIDRQLFRGNPDHADALARALISKAMYLREDNATAGCSAAEEAQEIARDPQVKALAERVLTQCSALYWIGHFAYRPYHQRISTP